MKEIFYEWADYNSKIFYLLNNFSNKGIVPDLLNGLSWCFNIENFVFYYLVLCSLGYFKLKKFSRASNNQNINQFFILYNKLIYVGICYAVFGLTYAALKFSVNMPRPFCSLTEGSFKTIINTLNERCMSSFPSAHAGLALMVIILSWSYLSRIAKIFALLALIMVSLSRITLSMHYPADIIYSFIIVIFIIQISKIIFKVFKNNLIKFTGQWISRTIY